MPLAAGGEPRVLFLAGWGRSGSTLLTRILGSLPGTVSVGETRDIWTRGVVENRLCGCGQAFHDCSLWRAVGSEAFGGWTELDIERVASLRRRLDRPWTYPLLRSAPRWFDDEVAEYAAVIAKLYRAIGHVSGARTVIDSSKIATHALVLRAAGLPISAVHLTRDSRGVAHSWRKQVERRDSTQTGDHMLRYSTASSSIRYVLYNGMAETLSGAGIPTMRMRYEDLVGQPAENIALVAAHAGLEVPDDLLADLRQGTPALTLDHSVDGNPNRHASGITVLRRDDAWQREMSPWRRRVVTAATMPMLARYGYVGGANRRPSERAAIAR